MPYPNSPFLETFDINSIINLGNDDTRDTTRQNLDKLLKWMCQTPSQTTIRVNTLRITTDEAKYIIKQYCSEKLSETLAKSNIFVHPILGEVLIIQHNSVGKLPIYKDEVIVDAACAAAVLRGAHIYVPGVIGMLATTKTNDTVSIYADVSRKCKKGYQKTYADENKIFIGNGIVKIPRYHIFANDEVTSGIAVQVFETISGCPSIGDDFTEKGLTLLQNLPSIICTRVLDPKPGDTVLDMCASPGNKTTHIAALMENKGVLIAIDKTPGKVKVLEKRCQEFGACVSTYQFDSTKIHTDNYNRDLEEGPPFSSKTFDRILLDAPCSALGKRPQLANKITEKELRSYVPLQKKLIRNAIPLLKPTGTLVYSTCTVTLAENEAMMAWLLKSFPEMKLVKAEPHLGGAGWPDTGLTEEQRNCVQRFGPDDDTSTIGFFIAKLVKCKSI